MKGGEKSSFHRHYDEWEGEGEDTHVVHKVQKCKHSKKFLYEKQDVFPIVDGMLQPGLYQIDFQLDLPNDIPSSLNFKDKHTREKPKAKVKYHLKAKLECNGHDLMKHKQVLIIREKPVEWRVGERQSETSNIKTWCCIDQGTSTMWSEFEKNQFIPTEFARGKIHINNENCQVAANRVSFFVEQVLRIKADGHYHTHTTRLVNRTIDGPQAGQSDWSADMELNLAEIRYEVPEMKKKKGVMKPLSKEDRFMMAGIQAACSGKKIKNNYYLCVLVEYDGCVCCVDLPGSRMPMTIIPIVDPTCFGFQPPTHGWEPANLGGFRLNLQHYDDSD